MNKKIESIKVEKVKDITFTYVGTGIEAPESINFMGIQKCYINEPFTVDGTKSFLIDKLRANKSFILGSPTVETTKARKEDENKENTRKKKVTKRLNEIEAVELRSRKGF